MIIPISETKDDMKNKIQDEIEKRFIPKTYLLEEDRGLSSVESELVSKDQLSIIPNPYEVGE